MNRKVVYLLVAAVLSACSLAPDYQRPVLPVDDQFVAATAISPEVQHYAHQIGWKEFFQDERLQKYIGFALQNNRDLRIAMLNTEEARLSHRIAEAARLPRIDGSGGYSRQRSGDISPNKSNITEGQSYSVGVSNFELDFFGKTKSLDTAALNTYLGTIEAQKSIHISLIAQVSRSYFDNRLAIEQLELAKSTFNAYQASYNLVKQQVDAGIANDLELAQALGQVHAASVQMAVYERQVQITSNTLYQLVGVKDDLDLPKAKPLKSQDIYKQIPVGLPSEVLLVRPDILGKEYQLKAANANIGAARTGFFPSITLTTVAGSSENRTRGGQLTQLFHSGSSTWAFSPQINVPIFNWGDTQARVDLTHVRKNSAIAEYEKTIQLAFKEVSDGLGSIGPIGRQLTAQKNLVTTTSESLRLANLLYTNGIANYLDVLDAQRTLFNARQELLSAYHMQIMNAIQLYTALGGGIVDSEESFSMKPHIAK